MTTYLTYSSPRYCRIITKPMIMLSEMEFISVDVVKRLFHKLPKEGEVFEVIQKARIQIRKRNTDV